MSLNVFKNGSTIVSNFIVEQYLFKFFHVLTVNRIKYVLYDGTNL
jgi:hypothetical protein